MLMTTLATNEDLNYLDFVSLDGNNIPQSQEWMDFCSQHHNLDATQLAKHIYLHAARRCFVDERQIIYPFGISCYYVIRIIHKSRLPMSCHARIIATNSHLVHNWLWQVAEFCTFAGRHHFKWGNDALHCHCQWQTACLTTRRTKIKTQTYGILSTDNHSFENNY